MAKDDGVKQFWAGIFFLLGVALTLWVVYFIGFQKGYTEPKTELVVLFDKVSGLSEGAPVRLSGVMVGTVERIEFLDEDVLNRGLKLRISIYQKYAKQVERCTQVSILTEGVLGAKYVEIGRVAGEPPLDITKPIIGEPLLDVYDLAEVLQDTAASFNETTRGINSMMNELRYISRKSKRLLDRIEQRVIEGNLFKVF
ncbi:MAG: MCE family protein [Candidatus Omnitrophica bacterium]|nr:MCE family protein [Candidatus Omnitrophota bacterium]